MTDTTQPPAETLAECPFCGSPDASMSYSATMQSPEPANRFVECGDCGSMGPYVKVAGDDAAAQALASTTWNSRAALTRRAGGDAGPVAALIQWARDQMALPDGSGWLGGHIDENHRYKLRDLVGAIDAAKPPAGGDAGAVRWRERWYGSDPQRGSAIVDEAGNLIAYFGGDEETHRATTAAVAAHNAALALPAPVVEGDVIAKAKALLTALEGEPEEVFAGEIGREVADLRRAVEAYK